MFDKKNAVKQARGDFPRDLPQECAALPPTDNGLLGEPVTTPE